MVPKSIDLTHGNCAPSQQPIEVKPRISLKAAAEDMKREAYSVVANKEREETKRLGKELQSIRVYVYICGNQCISL